MLIKLRLVIDGRVILVNSRHIEMVGSYDAEQTGSFIMMCDGESFIVHQDLEEIENLCLQPMVVNSGQVVADEKQNRINLLKIKDLTVQLNVAQQMNLDLESQLKQAKEDVREALDALVKLSAAHREERGL